MRGVAWYRCGMPSVFIPVHTPTMNEIISWKASYRSKYNDEKRSFSKVAVPILRELGRFDAARVTLHVVVRSSRMDPDGICAGAAKFVLDCMVRAGVLPDDSQRHVLGLSFTWSVNPDSVGCFVLVEPA